MQSCSSLPLFSGRCPSFSCACPVLYFCRWLAGLKIQLF
ncbi:hypothetical protein NC652_015918 [Populus alba x Populus x berolinensis]|uniref:Uncharacterized protein n=1 Tax=Populus alba x Populus x berolinensis TaxID=444605 RepID=A0AAD6QLG0_9ROSI|nr:hypothetical protein NC652_015918 [Populus alba x Populus x berolinensis]KAJ6992603.1 hypothetical protein NC653_015870 [Populus alba x Populus x berolinensis]